MSKQLPLLRDKGTTGMQGILQKLQTGIAVTGQCKGPLSSRMCVVPATPPRGLWEPAQKPYSQPAARPRLGKVSRACVPFTPVSSPLGSAYTHTHKRRQDFSTPIRETKAPAMLFSALSILLGWADPACTTAVLAARDSGLPGVCSPGFSFCPAL